jgi:transposase
MRAYPSSFTDAQWYIFRAILSEAPTNLCGRPREHSCRDLLNGIFYIPRARKPYLCYRPATTIKNEAPAPLGEEAHVWGENLNLAGRCRNRGEAGASCIL